MITIRHSFTIEIEILDAHAAIRKRGKFVRLVSRIPVIRTFMDRKVKNKIETEIRQQLTPANIQLLIERALIDKGVNASVRVS